MSSSRLFAARGAALVVWQQRGSTLWRGKRQTPTWGHVPRKRAKHLVVAGATPCERNHGMIAKVLLHDRKKNRYYAGPGLWASAPELAMDLGGIRHAAKVFAEEELAYGEILIDNGDLPGAYTRSPKVMPEDLPHTRGHR